MGGKTSQSSQKIDIPPEVWARYQSVNAQAQQAAQTPFQTYGGEFVAGLNAQQQQGISGINAAANQAQPSYQQAQGTVNSAYAGAQPYNMGATAYALGAGQAVDPSQINGAAINQFMSPYLQNVAGSEAALLNQNQQQAMAGQLGNAITSGAFGGDRAGIAAANLNQQNQLANANIYSNILNQGFNTALGAAQQQQGVNLSAEQANRAALAQASGLLSGIGQQQYAQGLGAAQETATLGQGAQDAALQGAQAQIGAGTLGQQTQQAQDTALYNQFLQKQAYPFQVAQFLANIAEGTGALSGSTTTTTTPGGLMAARGGAIKREGRAYGGETSQGGVVGLASAGEGFAFGGQPTLPGVSSMDLASILQAQEQMFAPYSNQTGLYGGQQGSTPYGGAGHVPAANVPVSHLSVAGGLPQHKSGAQSLHDQVQSAQDVQDLWKGKDGKGGVKGAYNSLVQKFSGPSVQPQSQSQGIAPTASSPTAPQSVTPDGGQQLDPDVTDQPEEPHYRGGLVRYADGGSAEDEPGVYGNSSSPTHLDIPEERPDLKLPTPGQLPSHQSGLGQLGSMASSLNSLGSLGSNIGDGLSGLFSSGAGDAGAISGAGDAMDVLAFAARGGAINREGHAYGGVPGMNPAMPHSMMGQSQQGLMPGIGVGKGTVSGPMHPAIRHALEGLRRAEGGRIHKEDAGSVSGDGWDDNSPLPDNSDTSVDYGLPPFLNQAENDLRHPIAAVKRDLGDIGDWWTTNVTGKPGHRSGFGQSLDQGATFAEQQRQQAAEEQKRNALAKTTSFFSPGTPEELSARNAALAAQNERLAQFQNNGRPQAPPPAGVKPTAPPATPPAAAPAAAPATPSAEPSAPLSSGVNPAEPVQPPVESAAAPPPADAGLAAKKDLAPSTNEVPYGTPVTGVAPPADQSKKPGLVSQALGMLKDKNGEYDSSKIIPLLSGISAAINAPTKHRLNALAYGTEVGAQSYLPAQAQQAQIQRTNAETQTAMYNIAALKAPAGFQPIAGPPKNPNQQTFKTPDGTVWHYEPTYNLTDWNYKNSSAPTPSGTPSVAATISHVAPLQRGDDGQLHIGPSDATNNWLMSNYGFDPSLPPRANIEKAVAMGYRDVAHDYRPKQNAWNQAGFDADSQMMNYVQLGKAINSLRDDSFTGAGPAAEDRTSLAAVYNYAAKLMGINDAIDPVSNKEITAQQIIQKITALQGPQIANQYGERAANIAHSLSSVLPGAGTTKEAANTNLAGMMTQNQRLRDFRDYANNYVSKWQTDAGLEQGFNRDFTPIYAREKEKIPELFKRGKANVSRAEAFLSNPSKERIEKIEKGFKGVPGVPAYNGLGEGMTRYLN